MISEALPPRFNPARTSASRRTAAADERVRCEQPGQLAARTSRPSEAASFVGVPDRRVRAACALIDERLDDELSLTVLAGAVGLSSYHFLRTFRAAVGTTPKRYILNRRLDRARERLALTSATISRIASDLAFASASHLASSFRERFGLSPTEYRRSLARDPEAGVERRST